MFTRLGYFVIIAILAIAGGAIAFVAWSAVSGNDSPSTGATPTATSQATVAPGGPPSIPFSRVIELTRFGAVLSIDARGTDITVNFREDFDVSGFNTTAHVFKSSLEPGQDVVQVLETAGIRVNGADGVTVTQR